MTILGFEIAGPALGLGVLLGMNYALLGVGLVLVHRNSKLVNFAHGDIGAGGAVLLWVAHSAGVPYWVCFPVCIAIGGVLAAVLERSVVQRLRAAPRAIAALATLGAGQLVLYVTIILIGATKGRFPQPPGVPGFELGTLVISPGEVLALIITPLVVAALALFMTKTSLGLALRAVGADLDLARVAGFAGGRLSATTWGLSGMLSAITAILLFGLQSDSPPPTGLDLLLPALTAGVIGRMTNLIVAAIAGLGLGILQHLLLWNDIRGGHLSVVMFAVIFVVLLLDRGAGIDIDKRTRWVSIQRGRRLTIGPISIPMTPVAVAALGSFAVMLVTPTDATKLTTLFGFILLATAAAIVTGLSGQLILGQVAYAGFGALSSITLTLWTGNFFLGFAGAAAAGGAVALISTLPALRRRDLSMAVLSLAFAFATLSWAFPQTWAFGRGIQPGRPIIGSLALTTAKSYAFFALLILCLGLYFADRLWRSALARRLAAQRDNPLASTSYGFSQLFSKAQALLIAGALSGVGGAVLAHAAVIIDVSDFSVANTMRALGGAALGGITSISGSVVGTIFMVGVPLFVGGVVGFISAGWVGWLLAMVSLPSGIAPALRTLARTDESLTPTAPEQHRSPLSTLLATDQRRSGEGGLLRVDGVSVDVGTKKVLEDVSFDLPTGGVLGLVGRNGAGKSTLLDVISGHRLRSSGEVWFGGEPVSQAGPERRARLGMVRSFEGAVLFPTMTVFETTLLALENPATGIAIPRRDRRSQAAALLAWMGLERIAHQKVGELSTGLRRMAQVACLAARVPRLMLLDEPASGIAQAEIEGLIEVLGAVKAELGASMIVVEHELRIVQHLAAEVIVLDTGGIIAKGPPGEVLRQQGQG